MTYRTQCGDLDSLDLSDVKPGQCIPINDVRAFKPPIPVQHKESDKSICVDVGDCIVELAATLRKYNFTIVGTHGEVLVLARDGLKLAVNIANEIRNVS